MRGHLDTRENHLFRINDCQLPTSYHPLQPPHISSLGVGLHLYGPALTPGGILRAHSNYTETSYSNYVPELDEEYLLTERHDSVQKLADMEVESKQEKDQKLKKWVRRFRFVVRVLNLGCRFVSTRSCLIAVSS